MPTSGRCGWPSPASSSSAPRPASTPSARTAGRLSRGDLRTVGSARHVAEHDCPDPTCPTRTARRRVQVMTRSESGLIVETRGHVRVLTLDRPERRNALSTRAPGRPDRGAADLRAGRRRARDRAHRQRPRVLRRLRPQGDPRGRPAGGALPAADEPAHPLAVRGGHRDARADRRGAERRGRGRRVRAGAGLRPPRRRPRDQAGPARGGHRHGRQLRLRRPAQAHPDGHRPGDAADRRSTSPPRTPNGGGWSTASSSRTTSCRRRCGWRSGSRRTRRSPSAA